jgi:hypothetical protein
LSRRSALLRPAPTAARPPTPLPGFAGYRRGIASRHPAGDGAKTALPSSQADHPHVQRPIRRRVPQRPLLDPERFPWPSPRTNRLGTLSFHPEGRGCNDAYSGFTRVADRAVAPAPLRTQPLDHARGLHYRGPRRLPGPDSHRQAALNLSLLYVMWFSFPSRRRSSLGALVQQPLRKGVANSAAGRQPHCDQASRDTAASVVGAAIDGCLRRWPLEAGAGAGGWRTRPTRSPVSRWCSSCAAAASIRQIAAIERPHGTLEFTSAPGPAGIRQIVAIATVNDQPVIFNPHPAEPAVLVVAS